MIKESDKSDKRKQKKKKKKKARWLGDLAFLFSTSKMLKSKHQDTMALLVISNNSCSAKLALYIEKYSRDKR